jgi:hypothetical protein
MALKPFQDQIIELMITQERMLSTLYDEFARQFDAHEKFWRGMSQEEDRHAKLLEKLYTAAKKGQILFDEGNMRVGTLTAFVSRLESILEKARNNEFTLSAAFSCAIDYETSLIEKNIFLRFDSLNDKAKATLKILQSETLDHVKRVRSERTRAMKLNGMAD